MIDNLPLFGDCCCIIREVNDAVIEILHLLNKNRKINHLQFSTTITFNGLKILLILLLGPSLVSKLSKLESCFLAAEP